MAGTFPPPILPPESLVAMAHSITIGNGPSTADLSSATFHPRNAGWTPALTEPMETGELQATTLSSMKKARSDAEGRPVKSEFSTENLISEYYTGMWAMSAAMGD